MLPTGVHSRRQSGTIASILTLGFLLMMVMVGCFGMDVSHMISVKTELHRGSDAGALAGAQDLINPATEMSAEQTALTVAENNSADGKAISNSSSNTQVLAWVEPNWAQNNATCFVEGEMGISNLFAKIFDRHEDVVTTRSAAIAYRSITAVRPNIAFPLAVSITTLNANGKKISEAQIGDQILLELNSQKFKNAAFTSLMDPNPNANWLKNAIDMLLGFQPMQKNYISGVEAGNNISLINGIAAQKQLGKSPYLETLTNPKLELVLPVMEGDPPYNQERKCVGFITIRVKNVVINQGNGHVETFEAELVKGVTKGTGGLPTVGTGPNVNQALRTLSPGTVQLVM